MDTVKAVIEPIKTVPAEFWYATTCILAAVLIWIIQKYFASVAKTMESMGDSIKKLADLVNLHDYQIKELQSRNGGRRKAQ